MFLRTVVFSQRFYGPKSFSRNVPKPPLSYQPTDYTRYTRNDFLSYTSIKRLNQLLKAKKTSISEIASCIIKRQKILDDYNFIVSKTEELIRFHASVLSEKYEQEKFKFFTYALKDTTIMSHGQILCTNGSVILLKAAEKSDHSLISEVLRYRNGLFVGTTSLPEFGYKADTNNLVIGQTYNPHDPTLTIGGSSGGSAGAVASGICQVGMATDAAGSIVIPAAFAGVVGVKPSNLEITPIDKDSFLRLGFGSGHTCRGWFTRTIEDTASFLDILTQKDYYLKELSQPFEELVGPAKPRIAYLPTFDYCKVDDIITKTITSRISHLEVMLETRCSIFNNLGFRNPSETADIIWLAQYAHLYKQLKTKYSNIKSWEELLDPELYKLMKDAEKSTTEQIEKAVLTRTEIADKIDRFFENFDYLITPATPTLPWEVGKHRPPEYPNIPRSAHTPFSYIFNYSRNASLVVPCGMTYNEKTGLLIPIALQIVANKNKPFIELLKLGAIIEKLSGYHLNPLWDELSVERPEVEDINVDEITENTNDTVSSLKEGIRNMKGIPVDEQRLMCKNKFLDDDKSLNYYGINNKSIIRIIRMLSSPSIAYGDVY